ncbi:Pachytene checkpoint protein 2 [Chamberlinius hualienensis]
MLEQNLCRIIEPCSRVEVSHISKCINLEIRNHIDDSCFIIFLIDEVESLSRSRSSALSGTKPSDAIRAVNTLLTQIDSISRYVKYSIKSRNNFTKRNQSLEIVGFFVNIETQHSVQLYKIAELSVGLSGRTLRKLPLIAHSTYIQMST